MRWSLRTRRQNSWPRSRVWQLITVDGGHHYPCGMKHGAGWGHGRLAHDTWGWSAPGAHCDKALGSVTFSIIKTLALEYRWRESSIEFMTVNNLLAMLSAITFLLQYAEGPHHVNYLGNARADEYPLTAQLSLLKFLKNNAEETTGNWNQPRDVLRIYQWKSRKRDDLIGYYLFLFFCKSNQICFINHESHVKTNATTNSKINITIIGL